mgnify:CR=1 FL=1
MTVPGFSTEPQPTSTSSPIIAPNFFKPVSISPSSACTFTNALSDFTLDVIEKGQDWLEEEVEKQGYKIKEVYIAEYKDGEVVIYPYEKKHRPQIVKTLKDKTSHTKDKLKSKL